MRHQNVLLMEIGEGVAVIRREGRSSATVAGILGQENGPDGRPVKLWLDRLVHRQDLDQFEGWDASGPFVTCLERRAAKAGRY